MAQAPTSGVFGRGYTPPSLAKTAEQHPGWHWQLYPDPAATSTGYTLKMSDPSDTSNGGKPREFFQPNYDYGADQTDQDAADQKSQNAAASKAALDAEVAAKTQKTQADFDGMWSSQSAEQRREFGVTTGLTASGQKNQVDIAKASRDAQLAIAKNALKENARQHDLDQAEKQREFDATNGLADQRLGLDTLSEGAKMRGPLNFVQGDAFAQGVSNGGLSPFVAALRAGTPVQFGGATGTTGSPTPLTLGTLANSMAGTGSGTVAQGAARPGGGAAPSAMADPYGRPSLSPEVQAAVDAGRQTYESGLANKPLGFEENQTQSQRDALHSIGSYLGRDVDAEDSYYRRSRPGQGNSLAA